VNNINSNTQEIVTKVILEYFNKMKEKVITESDFIILCNINNKIFFFILTDLKSIENIKIIKTVIMLIINVIRDTHLSVQLYIKNQMIIINSLSIFS
jgi:hypothetical protein